MEAAQIYTGHYCTKQVVSALPSLALWLTAMQAAGLDTTLHSQVQSLPWLLGSSSRAATTPAQNPNQTKVKPEFLWHSLSPTCWCPAISGSCFRLFSSSKDGYISVTLCSRALPEGGAHCAELQSLCPVPLARSVLLLRGQNTATDRPSFCILMTSSSKTNYVLTEIQTDEQD